MSFLSDNKAKIDQFSVISFDIFDTLLLRPYVKPIDLFEHLGILEGWTDFQWERIYAERTAQSSKGACEEITLDDIYSHMPKRLQYLKEKELNLEAEVLRTNPEMKEVFDYALNSGKTVIIISDMYVPQDFLESVLRKNGYSGYKKLYLSSTYKKLKATTNLYQQAIQELGVEASSILHIGDNEYSDVLKAKEIGITPIYYPKIIDRFFAENNAARIFYEEHKNDLSVSVMLASIALSVEKDELKDNYWVKFGYIYAGPIIFSFAKWLNDEISKAGYQDVLFVARDCWLLKQVFDKINTSGAKIHYIYAQRKFDIVTSLQIGRRIMSNDYEANNVLDTILSYYNITEEFSSIEDKINYIKENEATFEKLATQELSNYKQYLESLNLSQNVCMVDLMTSFFAAQNLLSNALDCKINAFYLFVSNSFIQNSNMYFNFLKNLDVPTFLPLIEFIFSSPEAPIKAIKNNKPVYSNSSAYEEFRSDVYNLLAKGVFLYVNDFIKTNPLMIEFLNCLNSSMFLTYLKKYPANFDKLNFAKIKHSWNPLHNNYIPLFPEWEEISPTPLPIIKSTSRVKFCKIPLLKIVHRKHSVLYKLFNFIPIYKIKQTSKNNKHYLFAFIKLFKHKAL